MQIWDFHSCNCYWIEWVWVVDFEETRRCMENIKYGEKGEKESQNPKTEWYCVDSGK